MADAPGGARTTKDPGKDKNVATKTEPDAKAKDDEAGKGGKGGKLKLIIIIAVVVVALLGGGGYFLFLKPKGSSKPAPPPKPVPGPIVQLDTVPINLANGHFLKLGIALQPTIDAGEAVSGAKALDLSIALFSGRTIDELANNKNRQKLKVELIRQVSEAYEKKVYDIYFTTFVFQ